MNTRPPVDEWDEMFNDHVDMVAVDLVEEFLSACSLRGEFKDLMEDYHVYLHGEVTEATPGIPYPAWTASDEEQKTTLKRIDDQKMVVDEAVRTAVNEVTRDLIVKQAFALSVAERIIEKLSEVHPGNFGFGL